MTGRATRRKRASKAAENGSRAISAVSGALRRLWTGARRSGGVGGLVLLLGVVGAILMVTAEFATYREIEVITASCEELVRSDPEVADDCVATGGEQHGWALIPLAALGLIMAWGAGPGRSRPAAWALAAVGVVVLAIAAFGDVPNTDVTGAVGRNFEQARGEAGATIGLELTGAALLIGAAALRLAFGRRE